MTNKLLNFTIALLLFIAVKAFAVTPLVKVACVGNSITAGYLLQGSQAYPSVLQNVLGSNYEVKNFGVSGTTFLKTTGDDWSYWGNNGKLSQVDAYLPNIIIIELGTNDSKPNYNSYRANLQADIEAMITKFKAYSSNPLIYVCLPVPAFYENFSIKPLVIINEIIPAINKAVGVQNVNLIDLNTPFLNHPELFSDGIHPTENGAQDIANLVYSNITSTPELPSVTIIPSNLVIFTDSTQSLTTVICPSNATNVTLAWSSSDSSVVVANSNGNITGIAPGNATINLKILENGKTALSAVTVKSSKLREADNPVNTINGIDYKYYEGNWSLLPNFDALTYVKKGVSNIISTDPKVNNDYYGFKFTGFINIVNDGMYTFYSSSDDGSKLYIGADTIVNNDGLHGDEEESGFIGLKAGKHAIMVDFFEGSGGDALKVSYSGPGVVKQTIPNSSLFRTFVPIAVTGITLNPLTANIFVGGYTILNATIEPINATNKLVNWHSSNVNVATVSAKGVVSGIANGTALITATTLDGNFSDTMSITVTSKVGVETNSINMDVKIFPNPASDYVNINLFVNEPSITELRIVNLDGKTIYYASTKLQNSVFTINTSTYQKAVYGILITNNNQSKYYKLMII